MLRVFVGDRETFFILIGLSGQIDKVNIKEVVIVCLIFYSTRVKYQ
jgi:hypothetical protein